MEKTPVPKRIRLIGLSVIALASVVLIVALTWLLIRDEPTDQLVNEQSNKQSLSTSTTARDEGSELKDSLNDSDQGDQSEPPQASQVLESEETNNNLPAEVAGARTVATPAHRNKDVTQQLPPAKPEATEELVEVNEPESTIVSSATTRSGSEVPLDISVEECSSIRNSFQQYPNPDVQAMRIERDLRNSDPESATTLRSIACIPHTIWLVGGSAQSVREKAELHSKAAQNTGKIPVFVLYNTPDHHLAIWHSGLIGNYGDWIRAFAEGLGNRPAWVILEPDALPLAYYYDQDEQNIRIDQLAAAVDILTEVAPVARVYIDAGHRNWVPETGLVSLLKRAGIEKVRGFSYNVSNFYATEGLMPVARSLSNKVGGAAFVIDTSRNGVGAPEDAEWCNTLGRKLGTVPDFATGIDRLDATLWIKPPGESDGWCNNGPQAGTFWLDYALDLVPQS